MKNKPIVGILMGSISDAPVMEGAREILKEFGVSTEFNVLSAHRTPDEMMKYAENATRRGIEVIIGGAGGAAHLCGMVAAKCSLPIIGVPIKSKTLGGMDSLLSIVQMPSGVPVATVAINNSTNAGLLALRILGIKYPKIQTKLDAYRNNLRDKVLKMKV
ncbi:MAG: 5-(carboxyamino)imidazole ribonucleotide mutase [Bacteroidota bacterium]